MFSNFKPSQGELDKLRFENKRMLQILLLRMLLGFLRDDDAFSN